MATLNDLNLKKGNTVFLYGNWNGNEKQTVDFFIQEYTIHSIGKKRCYLLYNEDVNSRREFSCTHDGIHVALTLEEAIAKCKAYQPEYTETELKGYEWRMAKYGNDRGYVELIQKMYNNLISAPQRILINPYQNPTPEIL